MKKIMFKASLAVLLLACVDVYAAEPGAAASAVSASVHSATAKPAGKAAGGTDKPVANTDQSSAGNKRTEANPGGHDAFRDDTFRDDAFRDDAFKDDAFGK